MSDVEMMIAAVCRNDEELWFYDNIRHYICFSDCNFDEVHIVKEVDARDIKDLGSGVGVIMKNQYLYIAYQNKIAVLVYSIELKEYHIFFADWKAEDNFYNVEEVDGYFLFIPAKVTGTIFLFNIFQEIFEQKKWLNETFLNLDEMTLFGYKERKKFFLPLYNKEILLELDLSDYSCSTHTYEGLSIGTICSCNNQKWIAQTDCAELVCVEQEYLDNSYQYSRYNVGAERKEEFFSRLLTCDGKIIGIPRFGDYVLIVDRNNGKAIRLYHELFKIHDKGSTSHTFGYYYKNHILYLLPWGTHKLLCVDTGQAMIYEKDIEVCTSDYFKYYYIKPEYEKDRNDLEDYLNWIAVKDCPESKNGYEVKQNKYVGRIIHEALR